MVLKEGFQWRLGDRVSIDVWKQPWLRSTNVAYIQTPMYPRMEDKDVQIEVQGERKIGYDFLNFFRYVKFRK